MSPSNPNLTQHAIPGQKGLGYTEQTGTGAAAEAAAAYAAAVAREMRLANAFESEQTAAGMRVELAGIRGLTLPGLLRIPFRFQVPPLETFQIQTSFSHNDFDTLSAGQHSRPVSNQLDVVTFSTLVVDYDPTWAVWPNTHAAQEDLTDADRAELWNVLNITHQLRRIKSSGTPIHLRAGEPALWQDAPHGGWDVNMPATLRGLTIEERSGEPDTRYLQVEFHEYRRLSLQRRGFGKARRGRGGRAREEDLPATVELFPDSSAIDFSANHQRVFTGEAETRLSAATSVRAATFPVRATDGFTPQGIFVCQGVAFLYTSLTPTSFQGCRPVMPASSTQVLSASSLVGQNPGHGVTLRRLAKRFYGKPSMWQVILRAPHNRRLGRLGLTGDELLGIVCQRLGVPSLKITIPPPPREPSVTGGTSPGIGGGGG